MKISLITTSSLLAFTLILMGCLTFRKSDPCFRKEMKKENIGVEGKYDYWNEKKVRYIEYHITDTSPTLIFVHGAPGSASAFAEYVKDTALNRHFNIILIDRLGYGYSEYGQYTPIETQAEWLDHFVKTYYTDKKVYFIGHSFGGPIVALAALKIGANIDGTIMIAPAIDPKNEHFIVGGRLAYWKATRWMFSKAIKVSASEKYRHVAELEKLVSHWSLLKTPILHIHGSKDGLVPYENLAFSKNNFSDSILETFTFEGKGHLIPFTQQDAVVKLILDFINTNK